MNVLLIYDLQGFLHKYTTECLRLQEIWVCFFLFSWGCPPIERRYPSHTLPVYGIATG